MSELEARLIEKLHELWTAYGRLDGKSREFDEVKFLESSPEEGSIYLRDIHRWFAGREGESRYMQERGIIGSGFTRDFSKFSNEYIASLKVD